jgi:hypothetical protein
MYWDHVNAIVAVLEGKIPGRACVELGPGPKITVRYYVEGTDIVLRSVLAGDRILSIATVAAEPDDGIPSFVGEQALSPTGAHRAALYFIDWVAKRRRRPNAGTT